MGTLRSFERIFGFLVVQLLLLGLFEAIGQSIVAGDPASLARSNGLALGLSVVAVLLVLLAIAWIALLEPVDIYWGLSARLRVSQWLIRVLLLTALFVICLAALIAASGRDTFGRLDVFEFADLALIAPIAVTLVLMVSAMRRWRSIRQGLVAMRDSLRSFDSTHLDRVALSIADEAGMAGNSVRPNPRGFTFAGLTSKPWHDPADFPWLQGFVDATAAIREEAERAMQQHGSRLEQYHYVGLGGNFWTNFSFVKRHEEVAENLRLCPTVAALLKTIPGYPGFRDAMFSILGPDGHIKPHRDVSNVFLTLHLPLIVEGEGSITVGGISRSWRVGEPLVFDSSYHHEARNHADKHRVILLVDFPHPDLTGEEAAWIRASRI